jgi:predicted Ser/Thr protein kinase
MSVCLSQELVEQYVNGSCSGDERRAIEAHLTQCEDCQRRIDATQPDPAMSDESGRGSGTVEQTQVHQDQSPTQLACEAATLAYAAGPAARSSGSMIEGYEILEELPRGGQAVVYKGRHTATNTKVAIKVLLPTLLSSARARYYFEREAELIARLDHPNIVKIRDSGIIHGQYFFVMEYIEGQPLNRHIRLQGLGFRERIMLFNKVCSAVSYAHQQGIIHRDLKFGNIMVDKRGEPHILDFGVAKAAGLSERTSKHAVATMTGQWAGSLSTMSPEQAAGQPDLIDVRSDVYSLGVILYHMLTGQYPYDVTGSTLEVIQNIQKIEPTRPRQVIRKFDSDLEAIVLTALAKDRAQRYQSAAELQSDIQNWLEGRPIRVKSISTLYLMRKIIARHRYAASVAALLLLIIIGFAGVVFDLYMSMRKAQREQAATKQWALAEGSRQLILARKLTFDGFLQAWRTGKAKDAALIGGYLAKGSKEREAAVFLLSSEMSDEKEAAFRQGFSDADAWFAYFIVGEYYLKNGNRQKALEAYRRSYQVMQDTAQGGQSGAGNSLQMQVGARLYELTVGDKTKVNG